VPPLALDRELEAVRGILELSIQMLDDEALAMAAAARRKDDADDDDEDESESRELGEKQSVGGEKLAQAESPTLFFSKTRSAR
jgi:hypothetical protein